MISAFLMIFGPQLALARPIDSEPPRVYHSVKANCNLVASAPLIAENPNAIPYATPVQKKIVIDGEMLGACLALATQTAFPKFRFSKNEMTSPYDSEEFSAYLRGLGRDDDPSVRVDYASGHEAGLKQWVLGQPQNSVDPVMLYRESLRLSEGNIFNAVLTVHQLLRNESRFWDKRRYCYTSDSQSEHNFFGRLIDIRGDLKERGPGFFGDHEGSWYRIFGVGTGFLSLADESQLKPKADSPVVGAMCSDESPAELKSWTNGIFNVLARGKFKWIEETKNRGIEQDQRKYELDVKGLDTFESYFSALQSKTYSVSKAQCDKRAYLKNAD